MLDRVRGIESAGIGTLIHRVLDDGKRFAKAEVSVQIETVKARAGRLKTPVVLFAAAFLLVQAAVVVLVGALGALLARWLGPAGGGAVAALVALVVAGVLAWAAAKRLSAPAPGS